jgi:hypothetical protein
MKSAHTQTEGLVDAFLDLRTLLQVKDLTDVTQFILTLEIRGDGY